MDKKESSIRAPRLLVIVKGAKGYGFNLHGERGIVGQFISAVDDGGPADDAGLCIGDRVVEVNGVNVEAATHVQVVSKIKEDTEKTQLLVVDKVTDDYMKKQGIEITADLAKLDTVVGKKKEEAVVNEIKVVVEREEKELEASPVEDAATEAASDNVEQNNDNAEEEVGQSVEDYLKSMAEDEPETGQSVEDYLKSMSVEEQEEKVAEALPEVASTDGGSNDKHVDQDVTVTLTDTAGESAPVVIENEVSSEVPAVAVEEETVEKEKPQPPKMSPPDVPPPAPPAAEPEAAPEKELEPEVVPEKEPEPEVAPEKEPEPEVAPEKEPEPEPVKQPEPVPEPVKESDAPKPDSVVLMKSASLPKPKRKQIKEQQKTDWASRAALFNDL
eukprot:gene16954-18661_t